ncbi:2-isopropylmalate synthase [Permianibacter sp. IMCC34836]|uniref:2-isopropylmalate synthase n=1 Tax=Permianibacter fluminis TaxID=2738515 RepID=UPI00155249B0|nr:2-isopropylmalate synthase [Permianibacter fluminis]NQD38387.1 2-isopropylmalate synthase [Permianibacter fluminis]
MSANVAGDKPKLIIFDTTLRDGEQSPGASMDKDEKIAIARLLERMKVDVIEAGFAIASPGDFESVQAVAAAIKDSTVCSLSRALDKDIERAAEALKPAARGRIHTFIATSPIHMKYKLQMEPDKVIEQAVRAVTKARNLMDDVEFSCEDAGRSEPDFLCRIIEQVINAGARTINIPDTVGYAMPRQYGAMIRDLIARIPNSDRAIFSVHCHNDLGLAVANSLDAVMNGARQVECTINGLGERAGNASLEEIVMAVRTRKDFFPVQVDVDTTQIVPASKLVSRVTGFPVQPNKAIVGGNAFAHESGIHQDGMLKNRETYEIMRAEDVGWKTNRMVLGKHSGRNAFKSHLAELGVNFANEADLNAAFARFKDLADKKHEVFDDDLLAIAKDSQQIQVNEGLRLVSLKVHSETGETPAASLVLSINGNEKQANAQGNGPVDAAYRAVNDLVGSDVAVQEFTVNAVTKGMDSQVEVNVRVEHDNHIVTGHGADMDIVVASVKAYLHALNTLQTMESRLHPHVATH